MPLKKKIELRVDKLSSHCEMLSSIICWKSPDDNDKDGSSVVIVLKSTEILLILTHSEYVTLTKMVLKLLWVLKLSNLPNTLGDEVQTLNQNKCCGGDQFPFGSFSLVLLTQMDISWSFQGKRGKHWVLGEGGGIFMRRGNFGGNFQQQEDRWSERGWGLTRGASMGIRNTVWNNGFQEFSMAKRERNFWGGG